MDRLVIAAFIFASATAAFAQTRPPSVVFKPEVASCPECGVVRSVKRIETDPRPTAQERESTAGFVASIPLGGGTPEVGSVTDVRREQKPPIVSYEVVVRLDDGRFQLVLQDGAEDLHEGDMVKIERGKVVPRSH
ncbi:MAG: hypothetical protein IPP91_13665 [Betaproteobacteria bacterium]|nr:hypothetical protein [Betaproteobacteria bacterium]